MEIARARDARIAYFCSARNADERWLELRRIESNEILSPCLRLNKQPPVNRLRPSAT